MVDYAMTHNEISTGVASSEIKASDIMAVIKPLIADMELRLHTNSIQRSAAWLTMP